MSFTANTAFEARITNNSRDNLSHIAGKYFVSTTPTGSAAGITGRIFTSLPT